MESDVRKKALEAWLATMTIPKGRLEPMHGDASMRRYFRLFAGETTYVVMDAPPPQENIQPFVAISQALAKQGLLVPEVLAAESTQGFLLLTDLGETTYLQALSEDNASPLYENALTALAHMQACRQVHGWELQPFDANWLQREWDWHKEWFLTRWLHLSLSSTEWAALDGAYAQLVSIVLSQPMVFMHRDYHSLNLMAMTGNRVGILDFQDAFIGPVTYDLVSLLRDCYIHWPADKVERWRQFYYQQLRDRGQLLQVDPEQFAYWFDWTGVQRHLKALMTFARKQVRDGQHAYLRHIPRTLSYLEVTTAQYSSLLPLHNVLTERVKPAVMQVLACAV